MAARFLSVGDTQPSEADLIFCLAGRNNRKIYALELFAAGYAPQLLLSTGRFELRRYPDLPGVPPIDLLALAALVPPSLRHYFVSIRDGSVQAELIPKHRLGTYREVVALGPWLEQHQEIRSVLVISSADHLRRIRLCWRSLIRTDVQVQFVAAPDEQPPAILPLCFEVGKILLYSIVVTAMAVRHRFAAILNW